MAAAAESVVVGKRVIAAVVPVVWISVSECDGSRCIDWFDGVHCE